MSTSLYISYIIKLSNDVVAMFTSIVVGAILCILILLYEKLCRTTRMIRKIPGPKAWPVIGNSLNMSLPPDKMFSYVRTLHKTYGDIVQLHAINARAVMIFNPEDVEIILSSPRYNEKREPYSFLLPWLGEGLLTSNGDKWRHRRKLLTQAFHFNILKKYFISIKDHTEELLSCVEHEVEKQETNLDHLIKTTTLGIMCDTAMNVSMSKLEESKRKKYIDSIQTIGECIVKRTTIPWFYIESIFALSQHSRMQSKAVKYLHKFTNEIIQERRNTLKQNLTVCLEDDDQTNYRKEKLAMLDLLLQNESKGVIDNEGIREEVDTFMFEGHDTTAVALTFMMMTIANEREVQDKILDELNEVFGESQRLPTTEDLNKMRYLECCIKESLRLYPSVPTISRYFTEDIVLGKYTIPAHTSCFISIFDIQRRSDIFPEPEKFIPERFLPENLKEKHIYSYIPFSAGSRNCIGLKFAMMEMKTVISGILRRFRLEPVTKPSDLVFTTDLILRTTHPVYVRFHRREPATKK